MKKETESPYLRKTGFCCLVTKIIMGRWVKMKLKNFIIILAVSIQGKVLDDAPEIARGTAGFREIQFEYHWIEEFHIWDWTLTNCVAV